MKPSFLKPAMRKILERIATREELVQSIPGGWWIENDQVHAPSCFNLLRLCLIHQEAGSDDSFIRYTINEDGVALLKDPTYIPRIVTALKEKYGGHGM